MIIVILRLTCHFDLILILVTKSCQYACVNLSLPHVLIFSHMYIIEIQSLLDWANPLLAFK